MSNKAWIKLGAIKKGKSGNNYIALGTPKSKFEPVTVELVIKDMSGKVLASVVNPNLNCQNPRKRPGITEEQASKIPDYIMAEISLPPTKEE